MALADTLAEWARSGPTLRAATVTAVAGARVEISIAGGSMTLPRLSWYAPTVGDVVMVLPSEIGWIVLGKVAV